jgi:soluble lytic murein transglycosylase
MPALASPGQLGRFWQLAQRTARQHPRRSLVLGLVGVLLLIFVVGPLIVDWGRDAKLDAQIDRYADQIADHAAATGLPVDLVRSVVLAESGGRADAVSPVGARGLMQVTAITEKDVLQRNPDLEPGDLHDPDYNLRVGTTYLAYLLDRFDGDLMLALTAYHMGPTAVRRVQRQHPGITPAQILDQHAGPQTRYYVRKVLATYRG